MWPAPPPTRLEAPVGSPRAEHECLLRCARSLPHGHVAAVLGTLRKTGLEKSLAAKPSFYRDVVAALIVARVLKPLSKLATARGLNVEIASTSLARTLHFESVDEDDLYRAMDWLGKRQESIEKCLARRHLSDGSLVLYDVTSSYYTGTHCPLAAFGYNRDRKKGFPQIVYGLLCGREGCPVAVEVFEGNTADPKTLGLQLQKIRNRFALKRIVIVGDRGMITTARIREDFRAMEGFDWITALRAKDIQKLARQGALQRSLFDERDLVEVISPEFSGERLIACRNPLLAAERDRNRKELLEATEKELRKVAEATRRPKRALRGKAKIGMRVGRVLQRFKMGKHFKVEIAEESFSYTRRTNKIETEAALDGIYVIRTSVSNDVLDPAMTVRAYKDLAAVERAFRSMKTIDLKVRPIFHRAERRVRAHVFLCMLAYYVEWHMRKASAPILFDDENKEEAEKLRASIVAPAQRSPKAKLKAMLRRTEEGQPVHSFQTLLADLATVTMNHCRIPGAPNGNDVGFWQYSIPTPNQQKAFDLLGVSLVV